MEISDEKWIGWMDELSFNVFVFSDNFIADELFSLILSFFKCGEEDNKFKKAGVGSSGEFQIKPSVRGDFICWLDRERDKEMNPFFEVIDTITEKLKRFCFLSLSGSEFHIAKYPEGSHYNRHLDQFHEKNKRLITVLIYLNENWKKGDGGELKIYTDKGDLLVEPLAKRLVLFKSDKVEHEVLKTHVPRYSITGWLLNQPPEVGFLA
jgi:SM-20-related protein